MRTSANLHCVCMCVCVHVYARECVCVSERVFQSVGLCGCAFGHVYIRGSSIHANCGPHSRTKALNMRQHLVAVGSADRGTTLLKHSQLDTRGKHIEERERQARHIDGYTARKLLWRHF